ncbi:GRP family sugar transporter [Galbibacter mesophilus]|uniref:GRP family sugar transporter n=1 Tax=Galbibacter mesophilus TaxID=379069 RepID=UPI00191D45E8|nr:GRP family sugar transporter [Galbibacter mesophilus]MCM5664347.1 GRP family sugar transporter [Galbibacter mesophilus]
MNSTGIIYALITVLAWGTWLAPSQKVPLKSQHTRTFYVTLAAMALSIIASFFVGVEGLNATTFIFPFVGGLIWAISGWSAFIGASRLGMAKAFGIWAPMNIVVSIFWGVILFGEFLDASSRTLGIAALGFLIIIVGILLIVFSDGTGGKKTDLKGLLGAMGAGVGFATYFIPIQLGTANHPEFTMWIGTLPLSIGMFTGSLLLLFFTKAPAKLEKNNRYFLLMTSGLLWAIGNYGALAMMEQIGTGRGFTIAQLCVVVNALVGVFLFKEPSPKSKAGKLVLVGVVLATIGGIILGNVN